MRVLQVHNRYRVAGGEDSVVALERELLEAHGHEVSLHSVANDDIRGPLDSLRVAVRTRHSWRARVALERVLRASQPDVVHFHNLVPQLTPSVYDAVAQLAIASVQTLHNYRATCANAMLFRNGGPCEDCIGRSPSRAIVHACYRGSRAATVPAVRFVQALQQGALLKPQRLIALSPFSRRIFIRAGLPASRLVVKPNFTSIDDRPRTPANPPFALYAGRLSVEKGIVDLVRHWPGQGIELRVAGDGPLAAQIRSIGRPNVALMGRVSREQISDWMRSAVCTVVPSLCYENFPMTVVEAWAAGCPVLAARVGALGDLIDHGYTGLLYDPQRSGQLAWALHRLTSGGSEAMSDACREQQRRRYSPAVNYRQLRDIYQEARAAL